MTFEPFIRGTLRALVHSLPTRFQLEAFQAAARGYNWLTRGDAEFFQEVSLEVNTECTRNCWYCIHPLTPHTPSEKMPLGVVDKVISDLAAIDFRGTLNFHYYNEPLLAKDVVLYAIRQAKTKLPKVCPILTTNGDLLTVELARELVEAGIFNISVTRHHPRTYAQDQKLKAVKAEFPNQVSIRGVEDHVYNMAGAIDCLNGLQVHWPKGRRSCRRNICLSIRCNGDVTACCFDYPNHARIANVMDSSILEIWNLPRFRTIRQQLKEGFTIYPNCHKCTADGYIKAEEAYAAHDRANATLDKGSHCGPSANCTAG